MVIPVYKMVIFINSIKAKTKIFDSVFCQSRSKKSHQHDKNWDFGVSQGAVGQRDYLGGSAEAARHIFLINFI